MSTDLNIEDITSELNISKKRDNSKVKVAICITNSNSNINQKKPLQTQDHFGSGPNSRDENTTVKVSELNAVIVGHAEGSEGREAEQERNIVPIFHNLVFFSDI